MPRTPEQLDFDAWEDEVILDELENGLCPWIFGSGLVTS